MYMIEPSKDDAGKAEGGCITVCAGDDRSEQVNLLLDRLDLAAAGVALDDKGRALSSAPTAARSCWSCPATTRRWKRYC